jgi:hypothetical protein
VKRPSFQFYPGDYRRDTALRLCSIAARGLWWDLVCLMHEGEPYGHLTVGGKPMSDEDAARMVQVDLKTYRRLLAELESRNVASRSGDGAVYSRRMVRDEDIRQRRAAGGHESLKHPNVAPQKGTLQGHPSPTAEGTLVGSVNGSIADPSPSSSSPSSPATDTPQPPTAGADAPRGSVALTLHRNGSKGRTVAKRPSATVTEVRERITAMLAEATESLVLEERRGVMTDLVFAYWAAKLQHPESRLDRKRSQTIRSRLIEAGENVHMLLFAVDGTLKDDNLMGRKDGRKYDQISTIFRDGPQVFGADPRAGRRGHRGELRCSSWPDCSPRG